MFNNLLNKKVFISLLCIGVSAAVFAEETNTEKTKTAPSAKQKAEESPTDRIRLESVIVGDKENPAISYFIPWQGIGTPDKLYWNVEEKHDNALNLVDREIMLRSIHFYEEMQLESPAADAQ